MRQRARVPLTLLALAFLALAMAPGAASLSPLSNHALQSSDKPQLSSEFRPDQDMRQTGRARHASGDNLIYGGGPVMAGTTHTYAIFWEPTGNVEANYNALIKRYFHDIGGSQLYRIARQYTQANGAFPANSVFAGSWVDTRPYPASPLLDSDVQNEVTRAQRVNGWHSSMQNIFFVFTQRNENVCLDNTHSECTSTQLCAYHSAFGNNTIYAALPYIASFACDSTPGPNKNDADKTITGISHEQIEAATDPLGNAWVDEDGNEVADKCVGDFGHIDALGANAIWNGDPYLVQEEWDNHTGSCRIAPVYSGRA